MYSSILRQKFETFTYWIYFYYWYEIVQISKNDNWYKNKYILIKICTPHSRNRIPNKLALYYIQSRNTLVFDYGRYFELSDHLAMTAKQSDVCSSLRPSSQWFSCCDESSANIAAPYSVSEALWTRLTVMVDFDADLRPRRCLFLYRAIFGFNLKKYINLLKFYKCCFVRGSYVRMLYVFNAIFVFW